MARPKLEVAFEERLKEVEEEKRAGASESATEMEMTRRIDVNDPVFCAVRVS